MAVGDLEGKIGELNGQLRILAPLLEGVNGKVAAVAEKLAKQEENLRQVWIEIRALKAVDKTSSNRIWQVVLALISAVIGSLITLGIAKLLKGGP